MAPIDKLYVVRPRAPMDAVLDRMEDDGNRFALVVDDGQAVGLLTLSDVAHWIRRRGSLAHDT